jgi:hypothetical protein
VTPRGGTAGGGLVVVVRARDDDGQHHDVGCSTGILTASERRCAEMLFVVGFDGARATTNSISVDVRGEGE